MSEDKQKKQQNEDKTQDASILGGGSFVSGMEPDAKSGSAFPKKKPKEKIVSKRFDRMIKKAEELAKKETEKEKYLPETSEPAKIEEGEVITKEEKVKQEEPEKGEIIDTFKEKENRKLEFEEDGSVMEEEPVEEGEQERGFFGKISDFFAEAGIDFKQIITGCIFLIFIGAVIWGLIWGYKKYFGQGEPSISEIVREEVELTTEEQIQREREVVKNGGKTGITSSYIFGYEGGTYKMNIAPQIGVSFIVGRNEREFFADTFAPIETAFYFGSEGVKLEHDFVTWVEILKDMKNAFETDLNALLDKSFDRATVLNEYLLDIKRIDNEAKDAYGRIYEAVDILKKNLNEAADQKKLFEEDFFTAVDDLSGEKSEFLLLQFIDVAQFESEVKARYNALVRLRDMYEGFMEDFDRRILEIEANKEALIKGVKVFDVGESTLDIVIPLESTVN